MVAEAMVGAGEAAEATAEVEMVMVCLEVKPAVGLVCSASMSACAEVHVGQGLLEAGAQEAEVAKQARAAVVPTGMVQAVGATMVRRVAAVAVIEVEAGRVAVVAKVGYTVEG